MVWGGAWIGTERKYSVTILETREEEEDETKNKGKETRPRRVDRK